MATVPDKPTLEGLEAKWSAIWEADGTYRFDRTRPREDVYAIDTPPPTVSGQLHLGTAFGYIQVDAMARFQRMRGREVFYPIGWDDNGLPTERRVQNHYGVRCDPTMSYQADLVVPDPDDERKLISRPNFLELCEALTEEDEKGFEDVFRAVGLSVDWTLKYATIDERSRRAAQRGFLRNYVRGEAYLTEAPTLWDIDYQTAVAQAELEDRTTKSAYHRLRFGQADGPGVEIETTRPELLAACVALVAHPDDPRYAPLFGTTVTTPGLRRGRARPARTAWPSPTRARASPWSAPSATPSTSCGGASSTCPLGPSSAATGASAATPPPGCRPRRRRRPGPSWPGRRWPRPAARWSSCSRPRARPSASPARSNTRSASTRRATARSRSSPAASGTSATAPATRPCEPGCSRPAVSWCGTRPTCASASSTGWKGSTPTG